MSGILVIHHVNEAGALAGLASMAELGLSLSDASKLPLFALILSKNRGLPDEIRKMGFEKVYLSCDSRFYDSNFSASVCFEFLKNFPCGTVLFSADERNRAAAARLAVKMNSGLIADATEIFFKQDGLLALKPAAGGNIKAEIFSKSTLKIITCKTDTKTQIKLSQKECGIYDFTVPSGLTALTEIIEEKYCPKEGRNLEESKAVIGVGRSVKKEDMPLVKELAEILGAAIGYTRPAVHEGSGEIENQIGISGKTIRPEIYLNLGVSGKNYHMAGIKGNPLIISVNTDEKAPIVSYSDYFVKSDYKTFLLETIRELKK